MAEKKYIVELASDERRELVEIVSKGRAAARKINHARVLLKADKAFDQVRLTNLQISQALDLSPSTVERVQRRFVEEGFKAALERREQINRRPKLLDGEAEARLIALACGSPPGGRAHWTLQLLADRMVELKIVGSISDETVRRTMKKKCAQALAKPAMVHSAKIQR